MSDYFHMNEISNTSGMGKYSHVPASVSYGFNFGAFCFNLLWLLYYKKFIFAFLFIICFLLFLIPNFRMINFIIFIALSISAGRFGNIWAWRAKKYSSLENFHAVHKKIAIAGFIFELVLLSFIFIKDIYGIKTYFSSKSREIAWKINNSNKELNPIKQMEKIQTQTVGNTYRLKFIKVLSLMNSAFSTQAILGEVPDNITSNALVSITRKGIRSVYYFDNRIIKTSDEVVLQFEADGSDCSGGGCYVLIDIDGIKYGPNKYWNKNGKISDRLKVFIKRNQQGVLYVEIPDYVMNNEAN